jgi:hypothetical protein
MSTAVVYESRPIRARRTKAQIDALCAAMYDVLAAEHPMTVRQVFYQLVWRDLIAKTEAEYKQTVVRLLTRMRRAKELPFAWISDNTRWVRKTRSYDGWQEALRETAATYRRALWRTQPVYCEVWLEKDALAGVVMEETDPYDVPLMVVKGYSSVTFLHSAAETLAAQGKPAHLYLLGDSDPSGKDISRVIERDIRGFARDLGSDVEIHFERIAVTDEQIARYNLPTRPTKQSDSRSKGFAGESVEVDALPPAVLRWLVHERITQHLDQHALRVLKVAEASERSYLDRLAALDAAD